MERLTRKLKKGGYSANRHSEAQLTERLDQLKGVHKQWVGDRAHRPPVRERVPR